MSRARRRGRPVVLAVAVPALLTAGTSVAFGWRCGPSPGAEDEPRRDGCVANPWPYLNGRRYAGPSGRY